ncbi:hypothetical protein [Nostoc sp. ChiVER01]|uniref:hypothetical protein n=1 Tax=Nostoc sp. ChiVER01 TaxID=3075382 RepID=UPI002AD3669C|nr:hypothetical protein [Nostoc sp. ChiVER01]MDZ8225770.1 hypothetical protein [Nostoc sp. ChiVER01]
MEINREAIDVSELSEKNQNLLIALLERIEKLEYRVEELEKTKEEFDEWKDAKSALADY